MPDIFPDQNNALVSIIIRSMARPTLAEALDSLAGQTWPHLEAVVVNAQGPGHPPPGPTCGRFPLRFVDTGRPLERSAAANAGLDAALGHYVGFLDDDDLLFPDHVAALVNALQSSAMARIAYSGVRMIAYTPDGAVGAETVLNQPFHLPSLRAQNYIPMHAVLFARTLLEAGCRFDETLDRYEDWDFWLQLAEQGEFLHVDQITACYRNFGHSGFGLTADAATIAAGRAALFDKWRHRWTGAELSEAFAALLAGVIHRQPQSASAESLRLETLAAHLREQGDLLREMQTQLAVAQQEYHAFQHDQREQYQRQLAEWTEQAQHLREQLSERDRSLAEQDQQLRERDRQLAALYQSTSWQITRPLRGLTVALRRCGSPWRRTVKPAEPGQ